VMQGHDEIVWAVEVAGSRLFSASADKTIRVWDIESRRCETVLEDHARPVLSLAVAGDKLFSGSYDYTLKVWSLNTLQRIKTLNGVPLVQLI
jgi:F-box and WD-40 domain protein 7